MKHTIDFSEIQSVTKTIELAGHFGQTIDKELLLEVYICSTGKVIPYLLVKNNKQVVFSKAILGREDIFAAIEKYNSIG